MSGPTRALPAAAAPETDEDWGFPQGLTNQGPSSLINIDETIEEHDSAVELAEIMMSFGRIQGAAETLSEYIRTNPRQAVRPWVKLLEVYKAANLRAEFDALALKLNQTFNVIAVNWEEFDKVKQISDSVEQMPHILQALSQGLGDARGPGLSLQALARQPRRNPARLSARNPRRPADALRRSRDRAGRLPPHRGRRGPDVCAPRGATSEPRQTPMRSRPSRQRSMLDLNFEEIAALPALPEVPPPATVTVVEFNLDEEIPPLPGKR